MAPLSTQQSLLDAVIRLTAQRDQEALSDVLVQVLTDLTQAHTACVYALQGELGHPSAKLLASSDKNTPKGTHITHLKSHPGLRECIEEERVIVTQDRGGTRVVFPVMEQRTLVGLVVVQGSDLDAKSHVMADGLAKVFSNQYSLLNHQQRDGLTGLFNRVAMQNWLAKALAPEHPRRAADSQPTGCFAIFDIDHFKRINDSLGHLYGDEVLLIFTDLMRESFRFNDLLFRYGGEEFVAVLSETDLETALRVLERFRVRVAQHKFPQINQVTVTIGVTQIEPQILPSTLIDRADKALYFGKNNGRDQVNAFEWLEGGRIVSREIAASRNIELF